MTENMGQGGMKKRSRFEWLIIVVVLVAGVGVSFGLLNVRGKANKSDAMMRELSQLRSAVTLYKTVKKANPPSLDSLLTETYMLTPGEAARPFLTTIRPATGNKLVDPFGHAYAYDAHRGWVHSATRGFENW
ncbi:MAG: hypothetical protein HYV03_03430 [Deltaproteobacteria bacterium]|nr:hypothetical protein [Deltaproteobacteria bacterium]